MGGNDHTKWIHFASNTDFINYEFNRPQPDVEDITNFYDHFRQVYLSVAPLCCYRDGHSCAATNRMLTKLRSMFRDVRSSRNEFVSISFGTEIGWPWLQRQAPLALFWPNVLHRPSRSQVACLFSPCNSAERVISMQYIESMNRFHPKSTSMSSSIRLSLLNPSWHRVSTAAPLPISDLCYRYLTRF